MEVFKIKKKLRKIVSLIILLVMVLVTILYLSIKSDVQSILKEKIKNYLKPQYRELVEAKNKFSEIQQIKNKIKYDKKIENRIEKEYNQLYYDFENPYIKLNPYGLNPLSALIKFELDEPSKIKLIVKDKYSLGNDYIKELNEFKIQHNIILNYLYSDSENEIELISENIEGKIRKKEIIIKTENLESKYPIIISKKNKNLREFILLEMGSYGDIKRFPLVIDESANIRAGLEVLNYYQNIIINKDNNFIWAKNNKIYEYNILGKLIKVIDMGIYTAHHDIQQKPNGNYLVTVNKKGSTLEQDNEKISTIEDYIIEITSEGKITKEWDFKNIMDTERKVIAERKEDWIHINSVFYDEERNEIIVSGNFQGIFSVDYNDNLNWIISDPIGYSKKFKEKLLSKEEINSNFKFPYGQHEATKLENGNILTFDNNVIHFDGKIDGKLKKLIPENNEYSRIVEYKVDVENMKVYQEWEYADKKLFSSTISGVKKYADDYLVTYGRLKDRNGNRYGKVRKVNKNKEIEYDIDVIYRDNNGASLYRSQILNLD